MPDLVVVVPNLNGASFLIDTLSAVGPAADTFSHETVVVDNGSTDGSAELVRRELPGVRVIANPENRGFAVACNQGGQAVESRYVLLLNSDVTLPPGSLARMAEAMDANPDVGALTPTLIWPDGRLQGAKLPRRHRGDLVPLPVVPGTCLLARREALDAVGWLDERFFFYNEDLDLSLRLRKAGWRIACIRSVRVPHVDGGSTRADLEIRARAMLEGFRGGLLLVRKHYSWAAGPARFGLRVYLQAQRLRIRAMRAVDMTLSDRDLALSACLEQARAALADPESRDVRDSLATPTGSGDGSR